MRLIERFELGGSRRDTAGEPPHLLFDLTHIGVTLT
jgi:hypothetical protein